MGEQEQRIAIFGRLAAAFPRDNVAPSTISVYAAELADIPLRDLDVIAREVMNYAKSFPTLGTIREAYRARLRPERQSVAALPGGDSTGPMPAPVRRQIEELKTHFAVEEVEVAPSPRPRGPVPGCNGIGKPAVLRNGKWVCPECGVDA